MPDAPNCSAVPRLLRVLENKGHVKQRRRLRYVYAPTVGLEQAKRGAVQHLLDTGFEGSPEQIVAALLDVSPPGSPRRNWTE
jgi:BlaI family penicillinase repressor